MRCAWVVLLSTYTTRLSMKRWPAAFFVACRCVVHVLCVCVRVECYVHFVYVCVCV